MWRCAGTCLLKEREREGAHHTEKEAVKSGSSGSDGEITAARSIERELIG